MAILFFDGFELYGTSTTAPTAIWDTWDPQNALFASGGRLNSGYTAVDIDDESNVVIPTSTNTVYIGFAYRPTSTGSGTILRLDDSTTTQFSIGYDGTDESFWVSTGSGTTPLVSTTTGNAAKSSWHYIEAKVVINGTTGTVDLWLNGVADGSVTSVDTQQTANSQITKIRLEGHGGTSQGFDDFYVLDTSGTDNTTRLDQPIIRAVVPSAETAQTDFTPSTGTDNSALVDEIPASDTDYNSSGTVTNADEYDLTNQGSAFSSINAVRVVTGAYKDDATTRGVTTTLKQSASYSTGTENLLSNSTTYVGDIIEQDPNTSTAWTTSGIDSMQVRVEITT
jgi:hypothetical protein